MGVAGVKLPDREVLSAVSIKADSPLGDFPLVGPPSLAMPCGDSLAGFPRGVECPMEKEIASLKELVQSCC